MTDESEGTLILCGRLVDGTGAPAREDMAVLVRGGQIAAVGPIGEVTRRREAKRAEHVDARDQTLLPGLVDGHAHIAWGTSDLPGWEAARQDHDLLVLWAVRGAQAALKVGITTLRDCGAPDGVSLKIRAAIAAGFCTGPRLLACGPCVTTTAGHGERLGITADSADELV